MRGTKTKGGRSRSILLTSTPEDSTVQRDELKPKVYTAWECLSDFSEMFHEFDFDATMLRIGSMNLMLHGIENLKIEARDSLSEDHAGVTESFTLILANPPFKGSVEKSTIAKDLTKIISTTKTELLFNVFTPDCPHYSWVAILHSKRLFSAKFRGTGKRKVW
jgi:type I restriction-modification system DNA methylase subunit